jgi:methylmalonyl-CoA/ethylmalonyl-CoA epimerase
MPANSAMTLHHVGYATAEIEPIARLYVERYGYQIVTPIIHDPTQTALVQFLRLAGDSTYLEFVAPDGPGSKLASTALKGSVLNHLCYAVDDIEAATTHLHESGMLILTMPVAAVAFNGRRISWLMGRDRLPVELVERGGPGEL